jgi:Zn-dependent protease
VKGTSPFRFGGGPGGPSGGYGGGGRWSGLQRLLGDGENPLAWGLPLYTAFGVRVKIHFLFLIYIAAMLIQAAFNGSLAFQAGYMGILFGLVLLHEYGHCFACRRVGGEADQIVLWPLGGLAYCAPPHHWRAEFVTVVGGPAVNLVLLPVLAGAVWLVTGEFGAVVFNPFNPGHAGAVAAVAAERFGVPFWVVAGLWMTHYVNFVLLAFNMLVPMFPMDAGRMVQALMWRKMGYGRSMDIAVTVGLAAAIALGVIAIVSGQTLLLGVAIFGGITCWTERQRLRFLATGGIVEDDFIPVAPREPTRADRRREAREREHFQRVERILDKIKHDGMASLSRGERKTLEKETRRQRDG